MTTELVMTNDERAAVIASEVEESRDNYFSVMYRDPSTPRCFAQDDSIIVIRPSSFLRHLSFVLRHFY